VSKLTQWQEVDEDLLPPINWWPMIFSIFVVYLPNGLAPREHASLAELLLTSLGMAAFVALVVTARSCGSPRPSRCWDFCSRRTIPVPPCSVSSSRPASCRGP
jgi:hypothetical protein